MATERRDVLLIVGGDRERQADVGRECAEHRCVVVNPDKGSLTLSKQRI
jgi:hypothetical protein